MKTKFFDQSTDEKFDLETALLDARTGIKIDVAVRGGPVRLIINGRHHKPTGRYASRKAGRSLPWEATGELTYFWLCEADAEVADYLSQPHRLTLRLPDGDSAVYYPDIRRDLVDGSVQIIEIKKHENDVRRSADYALKLELARLAYEGLGWTFDIFVEDDFKNTREVWTAEAIQRHRTVRVTGAEGYALIEALDRGGGVLPLAKASEALGGGPVGDAKLYAAIVMRLAWVDLAVALNPNTLVRLAPEAVSTLPTSRLR